MKKELAPVASPRLIVKISPKVTSLLRLTAVAAHNVYLLLYPKGSLQSALTQQPTVAMNVLEALQRITQTQLLSEGRVYGGGLHKLEPRELAQISALPVLDAIAEPHRKTIEAQLCFNY
jgi:hypothetical protein